MGGGACGAVNDTDLEVPQPHQADVGEEGEQGLPEALVQCVHGAFAFGGGDLGLPPVDPDLQGGRGEALFLGAALFDDDPEAVQFEGGLLFGDVPPQQQLEGGVGGLVGVSLRLPVFQQPQHLPAVLGGELHANLMRLHLDAPGSGELREQHATVVAHGLRGDLLEVPGGLGHRRHMEPRLVGEGAGAHVGLLGELADQCDFVEEPGEGCEGGYFHRLA